MVDLEKLQYAYELGATHIFNGSGCLCKIGDDFLYTMTNDGWNAQFINSLHGHIIMSNVEKIDYSPLNGD